MEDASTRKSFLALPEREHHVSRLLVLMGILAVVAGALWIYNYTIRVPVRMTPEEMIRLQIQDNPPLPLTAEQRRKHEAILNEIRTQGNPPLPSTPEQDEARRKILEQQTNN